MAQKERYHDVRKFMEGLENAKGLPENIATEAQLWDEILKKEAYLMHDQFFPLIHEIHGKSYPKGTTITPLATEYAVERAKTKEITSIRADITVLVDGKDIYHFECEIGNDGTMLLRMFEYDVHVALEYRTFPLDENGTEPEGGHADRKDPKGKKDKRNQKNKRNKENQDIVLKFPHSAVLYLQDNGNLPQSLSCKIQFPDGGVYQYKIPTLRVQSYS